MALFYFERIGARSHLRITRLGLVLILAFTILPVIALLSLFLLNSSTPPPNVDVTVKPAPAANTSTYPVITQPPPPPAPKAVRQPRATKPTPPVLATPPVNGNTR